MSIFNKNLYQNKSFTKRFESISEEITRTNYGYPSYEFTEKFDNALSNDINAFFNYYIPRTRFGNNDYTSTFPFYYHFDDNDLKLSARVYLGTLTNNKSASIISVSKGLLYALDDLMNRICCNKDFLSVRTDRDERVWNGTQCFWPQTKTIPLKRFLNYNKIQNSKFNFSLSTQIGELFSGIPKGDDDRMYLANLMYNIALTWILFHEESHYWHGHLHYSNVNKISDLYQLNETDATIPTDFIELFKTFEWQADRNATSGVTSLFFSKINTPFELPSFFNKEDNLIWYLRTMFVSIGSVILLFQKANLISGSSRYYPTPQTRLMSFFGVGQAEMIRMFRRGDLYFKGISEKELAMAINTAIYFSLFDLNVVEDVLIDNVNYDNDSLKSNYEALNLTSLDFLNASPEKIGKILDGFNSNLSSSDKEIEKIWFNEYKQLVPNHNYLYDNILPKFRAMTTYSGSSPY